MNEHVKTNKPTAPDPDAFHRPPLHSRFRCPEADGILEADVAAQVVRGRLRDVVVEPPADDGTREHAGISGEGFLDPDEMVARAERAAQLVEYPCPWCGPDVLLERLCDFPACPNEATDTNRTSRGMVTVCPTHHVEPPPPPWVKPS